MVPKSSNDPSHFLVRSLQVWERCAGLWVERLVRRLLRHLDEAWKWETWTWRDAEGVGVTGFGQNVVNKTQRRSRLMPSL